MDLNEQLGFYVGEYIISHHLPTLNTDMLQSNHVIKISDDDSNTWEALRAKIKPLMFAKGKETEYHEMFYEQLNWYKEMELKYLPLVLKCNVPKFSYTNKAKFIKGLELALWDSDMSSYGTKGVEILNGDGWWCTTIKLRMTVYKKK